MLASLNLLKIYTDLSASAYVSHKNEARINPRLTFHTSDKLS